MKRTTKGVTPGLTIRQRAEIVGRASAEVASAEIATTEALAVRALFVDYSVFPGSYRVIRREPPTQLAFNPEEVPALYIFSSESEPQSYHAVFNDGDLEISYQRGCSTLNPAVMLSEVIDGEMYGAGPAGDDAELDSPFEVLTAVHLWSQTKSYRHQAAMAQREHEAEFRSREGKEGSR